MPKPKCVRQNAFIVLTGVVLTCVSACDLNATHENAQSTPIKEIQVQLGAQAAAIKSAEKSCEPSCNGSLIIDAQCGEGDCSVYGTTCIADPTPRCGTPECPRDGEATVCLDNHLILACNDGVLSGPAGDCSAYGAWCSTAGVSETEARCVSALCFERDEVPYNREVCSTNQGFKLACYADATLEELACPTGEICSVEGGIAQCVAPIEGCRGPTSSEGVVDHLVCLSSGIGRCFNGNIVSEIRCDDGEQCSDQDDIVRCVDRICLDQSGALFEGSACRDEGELIECDQDGAIIAQVQCADSERCVEIEGQAECVLHEEEEAGEVEEDSSALAGAQAVSAGEEAGGEEIGDHRRSPEMLYQMEDEADDFKILYSCAQQRTSSGELLLMLVSLLASLISLKRTNSLHH